MIGFIIIRYVNSEKTNLLWQECYKCIRKYYDNKIIIIDDNSDTSFLTQLDMIGVEIIQSEFPKRAELLPYYYFLKHAWFDNAVILHDSVFIQSPIKFDKYNKFLWHFVSHEWDNIYGEMEVIGNLKNSGDILNLYSEKERWFGCFGVMSVITYNMIHDINSKYNFFSLLSVIKSRPKRMMLERIFAAALWYEASLTMDNCSYFGNIQAYCNWGFNEAYTMENYILDRDAGKITLPIVKLWSGR
jgi:hypothetical protein